MGSLRLLLRIQCSAGATGIRRGNGTVVAGCVMIMVVPACSLTADANIRDEGSKSPRAAAVWEKTIKGEAYLQHRASIRTSDGGCAFLGTFAAGMQPDSREAMYVARADDRGNPLWVRTYKDLTYVTASSMVEARDGGFVIAGRSALHAEEDAECHVSARRIKPNGELLWKRVYRMGDASQAYSVVRTRDECFLIVGTYCKMSGQQDQVSAKWSAVFLKVDGTGRVIWERQCTEELAEYPRRAVRAHGGGYVVAGVSPFTDLAGYRVVWLLKLAEDGEQQWFKALTTDVSRRATFGVDVYDLVPVGTEGYLVQSMRVWQKVVGGIAKPCYTSLSVRTDLQGNELWRDIAELGPGGALPNRDGSVLILGDGNAWDRCVVLRSVGANGQEQWKTRIELQNKDIGDLRVIRCSDAEYLIVALTGFAEPRVPESPRFDVYLARIRTK